MVRRRNSRAPTFPGERTNWKEGEEGNEIEEEDYRRWVSVFSVFYRRLKVPRPLIGFESKSGDRWSRCLPAWKVSGNQIGISSFDISPRISDFYIRNIWNFLQEYLGWEIFVCFRKKLKSVFPFFFKLATVLIIFKERREYRLENRWVYYRDENVICESLFFSILSNKRIIYYNKVKIWIKTAAIFEYYENWKKYKSFNCTICRESFAQYRYRDSRK